MNGMTHIAARSLVLAVAALSGSAMANDQQTTSQTTSQSSQTTQKQSANSAPAIVIGELVEMRNVDIKGQGNSSHRLLKVKPRDGEAIVVDLGAVDQNVASGLKNGDRVIAVGRSGRINGKPVVFARTVGELYSTGITGRDRVAQAKDETDAG